MDENKNQMTLYNNLNEKDSPNHAKSVEEQQLDKENYLKIYNYKYAASGCLSRSDENNKKNYSRIRHGDNIEQEEQNTVGDADDEDDTGAVEDNISSEGRTTLVADGFQSNYMQSEYKVNNSLEKEWSKEESDINLIKTQTTATETTPPASASIGDTHTAVATSNVKNIAQHLNQRHLVKDFGEQFLHGHQLNVHNLLDVAGSLCAGPMGALCDMAAISKLDCSPFGDLKDHTQNGQDFLAKKYYHPLYAHGVCRWPGCELPLDDMASFVKHLKTEHCLDDRSTAQARVQMQVVSQLEMHLQKERDRLQAMMHHLYLTKHFAMPDDSQENIPHIRFKNAMRSLATTPDLHKSNISSNDDSNSANDLQSLLLNSGNINATRKRICDKSPLALAGGLPYMLERAGLDVQQEIQRNREFYKNADVRPPFTYASLIRQNAIRTNLSLHKCFVRYEDDFGSFWMVDDSEFVKRRHLSRGRPRKYEPSSSPNSNSVQFSSSITASTASHEVNEGSSAINIAIATTSPDLSTAGSSSRQRCSSSTSSMYLRSVNKNTGGGENNGGNDDYNICEVSQRSPAGCPNHIQSGKKQYCGSKQRPHLQGSSAIGISIKANNTNSLIDQNRIASGTNNGGGVAATGNDPGISGIGEIGSVRSLGVDDHNGSFNSANTVIETEDPTGYDFNTQSLSSDAFLSSPPGSKSSMGRHSPNMQNMRPFGSSLTDEVSAGEFSCINSDRYRNLVTGLHLQSLTQRHHFQQHKQATQRLHPKTAQQQNALRNNVSNQHDVRSLHHQSQAYHIYPTNQSEHEHQKVLLDQHNQSLGQNIFGANIILSNTDKYFSHNIECRNESESFNAHQQQQQQQQQHHHNIRYHGQNSRTDLSADEITNHIYIHHHNEYEIDVKYTPPLKTLYNFESQSLNRSDVNLNKRFADDSYANKFSAEENSAIVDCEREEIQRKRRKNQMSSVNYDEVEIKAEADSESELRNIDIPLRTKSY